MTKEGTIRECQGCGRVYVYNRAVSGHSTRHCNSCLSNRRRFKKKRKAIEYKGGKCIVCGYSRCARALAFHHLDPLTKSFSISSNHGRKWATIQEELDKCVLLCQNCHAEVHEGIIDLDDYAPQSSG